MSREQLQERIKALQDAQKRLEAENLQILGAIADCNYWLTQILNEESKNAVSEKHDA